MNILNKIKCFLGFHDLEYQESFSYIEPACLTEEELKKYGAKKYTVHTYKCTHCGKIFTEEEEAYYDGTDPEEKNV